MPVVSVRSEKGGSRACGGIGAQLCIYRRAIAIEGDIRRANRLIPDSGSGQIDLAVTKGES
jgi:hypothetical protein